MKGEAFKKELEIWEKSVGFRGSNNIHLLLRRTRAVGVQLSAKENKWDIDRDREESRLKHSTWFRRKDEPFKVQLHWGQKSTPSITHCVTNLKQVTSYLCAPLSKQSAPLKWRQSYISGRGVVKLDEQVHEKYPAHTRNAIYRWFYVKLTHTSAQMAVSLVIQRLRSDATGFPKL